MANSETQTLTKGYSASASMACVIFIGHYGPITPDDITKAGHTFVCLQSAVDAWEYILPKNPGAPVGNSSCADVAVLGSDLSECEQSELVRWLEEETDVLPVLVLANAKMSHPLAYGYYTPFDSADEALRVVLHLLNGVERNR